MSRLIIPSRLELRPYVRNFMVSGFDSLDVHLPASTDVQIVVYLRGQSFLFDGEACTKRAPAAFVAGPCLHPRRFRVEPGSRFIAVTFRPSGFFSCFSIPVNALNGQLVALDCIVTSSEATALTEQLDQCQTDPHLISVFETFLAQRLPGRRESSYLPPLSLERLLMPAAELARTIEISARQLERRFLIRHGVPLRDYRRVARFTAALASLMQAGTSTKEGTLARTAVDAQYVDQAHFSNDFRQFVGESPGRFVKSYMNRGSVFHLWKMSPDELRTYLD